MMLKNVVLALSLILTGNVSVQTSETTDLGALRAQWVSHLHEKKLAPFVQLYAPDATFVGGGKRFTGHAAIHELTRTTMASFTSDIELRSIKTEFSGELAYDSGDYSETVTSVKDGTRTAIRGDYLTIYKRGADKKWLIVQQVWTEAGASH